MGLFSTISLKTKLFVLALIISIGAATFFYKQHIGSIRENERIVIDNEILTDNEEYRKWSEGITNEVVKEFVDTRIATIITVQKIRKEAIDEYTKDLVEKSGTTEDTSAADRARTSRHAQRMLELVCSARPEEARCSALGIPK